MSENNFKVPNKRACDYRNGRHTLHHAELIAPPVIRREIQSKTYTKTVHTLLKLYFINMYKIVHDYVPVGWRTMEMCLMSALPYYVTCF